MLARAREAIDDGHNQYPPLAGVPALREAVAAQRLRRYGMGYDPDSEVLVTAGATEAVTAAVLSLCGPGDEVVVLEPYYDSYAAAAGLAGARLAPVPLRQGPDGFRLDGTRLRAATGPRTRLMLLNSPHNPTGSVLSAGELATVAEVARDHNIVVVTDEVYEYLCYDGAIHRTIAAEPGMRGRTLVASSAGKTFNATGWKVGWLCGPADLLERARRVKQYLTFAGGTPFQHAVAHALDSCEDWVEQLRRNLQQNRDMLASALRGVGVHVLPCQGSYFIQVESAALGEADGVELCRRLPPEVGVAAVPSAVFYAGPGRGESLVRFAFCKRPDVLAEALSRLTRHVRGLQTVPGRA